MGSSLLHFLKKIVRMALTGLETGKKYAISKIILKDSTKMSPIMHSVSNINLDRHLILFTLLHLILILTANSFFSWIAF